MLKYRGFVKESVGVEFKKGDKVIFNPGPGRDYYAKHSGAESEITFVYTAVPNARPDKEKEYTIKTPTGANIIAYQSELTPLGSDVKHEPNKTMDYIETQFPKVQDSSETSNIEVGSRVKVIGKQGKIEYTGQTGTVKKVSSSGYLIEFEDDDATNQSNYTTLINKELVQPIDGKSTPNFRLGSAVKCIDKDSEYFNVPGIISNYWDDDNSYMVDFKNDSIYMTYDQLEQIEGEKKVKFNDPIPVSKPVTPVVVSSEEEDEDEAEVTSVNAISFKKEDLLEFSYNDFMLKEKISTHEDLLELKNKYQKEVNNPDLPKIKRVFTERSLATIDIIESYFQFLIAKVANGLPVYRTVEQIDNNDLLRTKTKVRASDSKELTRKYSFDQGIIAYWKFKDAIVFRTI